MIGWSVVAVAEVKWIKIVTDIFDNRKIKQIEVLPDADSILVIWFKLICLAGSINDGGRVYFMETVPYTDEMLATQFRRPLNTVRMALDVFRQFGMIEIIDDFICLPSWEKYQSTDKLEQLKEQNRLRQKKWYDKQKALPNVSPNVRLTQPNATDIDKEEDLDIEEDKEVKSTKADKPPRATRFTPPTVDDVRAYCEERANNVDPDRFVDFYSAKGWMVGKNKMKDWKAAVRNWERDSSRPQQPQQKFGGDRLLDMLRAGVFDDE